jgi:hypothetical protein
MIERGERFKAEDSRPISDLLAALRGKEGKG